MDISIESILLLFSYTCTNNSIDFMKFENSGRPDRESKVILYRVYIDQRSCQEETKEPSAPMGPETVMKTLAGDSVLMTS